MFSNSNTKNKLLSSKRLSNSLNDIKRKIIVKNVNKERENSVYIHSYSSTNNYLKNSEYIIVPDNELILIGDKKCKQYDIYNANLFKKNTKLYQDICQKIEGSFLVLKSKPSPLPIPINFERLMLYRQRNQPFNALHQTCAIIYLLQHNYLLVDDLTKVNPETIKVYDKTVIFEAYQAIRLASELSHIKGEEFTKIQSVFTNLNLLIDNISTEVNLKVNHEGYPAHNQTLDSGLRIITQSDNSVYETSNSESETLPIRERSKSIISSYPKNDIVNPLSNIYPPLNINGENIASAPTLHTTFNSNSAYLEPKDTLELKCDCPEHHNINHKVEYFNTLVEKIK